MDIFSNLLIGKSKHEIGPLKLLKYEIISLLEVIVHFLKNLEFQLPQIDILLLFKLGLDQRTIIPDLNSF